MASTRETIITIDDVVVSSKKNLYKSLGVKKRKANKDSVEKKGYEKIGKIISSSVFNTPGLEARLGASGISVEDQEDIKRVYMAYKIFTNPYSKAAYDANKQSLGAGFNITVDGEDVNIRDDFYTLLELKEGRLNPVKLQKAVNEKLGAIYCRIEDKERFLVAMNIRDRETVNDIEDTVKILSNDNNRTAYNRWRKNTKKETRKRIVNTADGAKAADIAKKALIGVGIGTLAAAIIVGSVWGVKELVDRNKDKDADEKPGYEDSVNTNDEPTNDEPTVNNNSFTSIEDEAQVSKRAKTILNSLNNNGIAVKVFDNDGSERALSQEDIEQLLYWCSIATLPDDMKDKACDMDKAAMILSQMCLNYDLAGDTNKRVAGFGGLGDDPNAGNYDFDLGSFFVDGTPQQQALTELSVAYNKIKNNPNVPDTVKAQANKIYRNGVKQFVYNEGELTLENRANDTANFIWVMFLTANQSLVNIEPEFSFEDNGVTYALVNAEKFIDQLSGEDGVLNGLGRDIAEMTTSATLGLECK